MRGQRPRFFRCAVSSVQVLILVAVAPCMCLPAWVVPSIDAVEECDRVARRVICVGASRSICRYRGVAAALVWLTLGELSPMTNRVLGEPVRRVVTGRSASQWARGQVV